ncbi:gp148 [Beggiatoa sp. PS]|nr:gp148 [Beggiatoa sp. PS]
MIAGSNKKVWWKCDKGDDHEWKTSLYNRTGERQGCPFCTLTPQSKQELILLFELRTIFKNISPKGLKVKLDNKLWTIDIYIPQLNLGIEYDGSHWHKEKKEKDTKKLRF